MTIYFISDLHLHASRPKTTELFLQFLKETAKKASALYILGDFFEVWVGDDQFQTNDKSTHTQLSMQLPIPNKSKNDFDDHDAQVIKALSEYTEQEIPVYFMHGNRDFLIAQEFALATGCTLIPDPYLVTLYNENYVLTHGDLLCTLDTAYQRFRRIVRNPLFKTLFLCLPLKWRRKIAGNIREKSQESRPLKEYHNERYDVTETAVNALLRKYQAYTIIHGHTHKPAIHEFLLNHRPAKRVVLGDWGPGNAVILKMDMHGLELLDLRNL